MEWVTMQGRFIKHHPITDVACCTVGINSPSALRHTAAKLPTGDEIGDEIGA